MDFTRLYEASRLPEPSSEEKSFVRGSQGAAQQIVSRPPWIL